MSQVELTVYWSVGRMPGMEIFRKAVSKNKRRYQEDGFDLDLSFITRRIIAMGFPSDKIEGLYRNPIDQVVRFMDTKFPNHYKVYNLCDNRNYDPARFHNRVACYPFTDHQPPNLELLLPFCQDVHDWLAEADENVVAIHCKAGKGRTGVMICAYLLYEGLCQQPKEALEFYGAKRTMDDQGVTIPSQRRYVEYFGILVRNKVKHYSVPMIIKSLHFECSPNLDKLVNYYPCFSVTMNGEKVYKSPMAWEVGRGTKTLSMSVTDRVLIQQDVRIDFYNRPPFRKKEKLFHFWFNTFFICPSSITEGPKVQHGAQQPQASGRRKEDDDSRKKTRSPMPVTMGATIHILTIPKSQLDRANKLKLFPNEFKVHLFVECLRGTDPEPSPEPVPAPEPEPPSIYPDAHSTPALFAHHIDPTAKHPSLEDPTNVPSGSGTERRGSGSHGQLAPSGSRPLERVKSFSGGDGSECTEGLLLPAAAATATHRKSADFGLRHDEEAPSGPRVNWSESDPEEEEDFHAYEEDESDDEPGPSDAKASSNSKREHKTSEGDKGDTKHKSSEGEKGEHKRKTSSGGKGHKSSDPAKATSSAKSSDPSTSTGTTKPTDPAKTTDPSKSKDPSKSPDPTNPGSPMDS